MKVQSIASAAQVSSDTVRYYSRLGLLVPVKNPVNGYKEYSSEDVRRLHFILRARDLGFSLADIQQIFLKADDGDSPCTMVRDMIEARLLEVKQKLDDMNHMYERMKCAVKEWSDMDDSQPCGRHICHLIEGVEPSKNKTKCDKAGG